MIKLEVSTHNGTIDIVEVDDYNPVEINELRNNIEIHSILIGQNSYSRINLMDVKVIEK